MAVTPDDAGGGSVPRWPPATVVAGLRHLFQGHIRGLLERAAEYQTDADDLDGETWALFEAEMQSSLDLLEAGCAARDASLIRGRGHSLEGMGGMVGLPDLSVVGAELSQAARDQNWERCALLTQQLRAWDVALPAAAEEGIEAPAPPAAPSLLAPSDAPAPAAPCLDPSLSGGVPASRPALVLIADDDPPNLATLRRLLGTHGYAVLEASDGLMALHLAQQHLPSLALIDVMMPGLTGYQVCERLKTDPKTHEIAVILVTARRDAEDVVHGLDAGAFDYIRKPFHSRELLARVRNALALKHAADDLKRTTDELQCWQQKMQHEIKVAGALQNRLFPTDTRCGPGYEVHLAYRPSSTNIGGDLFDAFPLPDGRLCVYMGDVAGHSVAPAIVSALLKMIIIEAALRLAAAGPAAVCREIQQRFRRQVTNPELYATLFMAFLDTQRGQLTCMNCGHPDPILMRADGSNAWPQLPGSGDMPIGFWFGPPEDYAVNAEVSAAAVPGSTLWLITDGLFEARHRDTHEPCGPERLLALLQRIQRDGRSVSPAAQLLDALRAEGFDLAADDCSAMAVECIDPGSIRMDRLIPLDLEALSAAAAEVERVLLAEGWSDIAASLARVVAMEHGANVIKHGRAPPSSGLHLQLRLTGSVCRLWATDEGREWEYPSGPKGVDEVPLYSEHGRGLALIQALTSHAEYYRCDPRNVAFFAVDRDPAVLQAGDAVGT